LDTTFSSICLDCRGHQQEPYGTAVTVPFYYTASAATDLDQILTMSGRILTSMVSVGPGRQWDEYYVDAENM
jgi:hypothetical protein